MLSLPVPPTPLTATLTDAQARWVRTRYPSAPTGPAQCPTCGGRGQFTWWNAERTEHADYECDCTAQTLMHLNFLVAGIGTAYQRLGWADYVAEQSQLARVRGWLSAAEPSIRAGLGLLLTGPKGCGKTTCAYLVAKELLAAGVSTHTTSFTDLLTAFGDSWDGGESRKWWDAAVRGAQVLVIDDIGREHKGRTIAGSALESLLRARVQNALPVILTSNMTQEQIAAGYGDHVTSVLAERTVEIPFTGADWRPQNSVRVQAELAAELSRPIVVG